ncbi:SWIB/MDM2 domain-containing protein [Hydrogenophaga sp.]|uniref:SWIB/MDM2 domain-containing protein n=2 Tax=Burkholderiales TaxID=80840 RepID=UPI0025C54466|nr:SWIB/MDM2 domain-containing protein [Hydrogenophaga sp.]
MEPPFSTPCCRRSLRQAFIERAPAPDKKIPESLARWHAVTRGSKARPKISALTTELQMTTAKKQTAFNRALTPSAELAAVIGATPQPRTEVVKLMWEYIKANNLQNPKNKRNILADAKLKAVFGKDEVTMFEMTGLVGKHLS